MFKKSPRKQNKRSKDIKTTYLFVEPSFWNGAGRIIDLWGGFDFYNYAESSMEADLRACYADWRVVGQDLRDAYYYTSSNSKY